LYFLNLLWFLISFYSFIVVCNLNKGCINTNIFCCGIFSGLKHFLVLMFTFCSMGKFLFYKLLYSIFTLMWVILDCDLLNSNNLEMFSVFFDSTVLTIFLFTSNFLVSPYYYSYSGREGMGVTLVDSLDMDREIIKKVSLGEEVDSSCAHFDVQELDTLNVFLCFDCTRYFRILKWGGNFDEVVMSRRNEFKGLIYFYIFFLVYNIKVWKTVEIVLKSKRNNYFINIINRENKPLLFSSAGIIFPVKNFVNKLYSFLDVFKSQLLVKRTGALSRSSFSLRLLVIALFKQFVYRYNRRRALA